MSIEEFKRSKPIANIGTIGHVGHGKTTLTAAITRVLSKNVSSKFYQGDGIDNQHEEQTTSRQHSVTNVEYETEKRLYAHTDCPGHSDYIKNMIIGASQMEAAILVVAANDGPMPQTREHIILARQMGVNTIVVFLNKVDLVDDNELLELVQVDVRGILSEYGFDGENIICGSALSALNGDDAGKVGTSSIKELMTVVDKWIPSPRRDVKKPFMMPIECVSSTPNGTVLSGKVLRGVVKISDEIEFVGYNETTKSTVTDIQIFHKRSDEGRAGDQIGILVQDVKRGEVRRGMVVSEPGALTAFSRCEAQVHLLKTKEGGWRKPLMNGYRFVMVSHTWDCEAVVALPAGKEMLMPGEKAYVTITLIKPMVIEVGQRFALREANGTVGTGFIAYVLS